MITTLGALVALIGGVKALLPDSEPPPAGEIRELEVNSIATVSEANDVVSQDRACKGREGERKGPTASLPIVTATVSLAAGTGDKGDLELGPGDQDANKTLPETTGEPATGEPSTGEEPPVTEEVAPEEQPEEADSPVVDRLVRVSDVPEKRLEELLWNPPPGEGASIDEEGLETIILHSRIASPRLANTDGVEGGGPAPGETDGTGLDEAHQLLGWLFDATTLLKHLDRHCAYLQWSLYDGVTRRRIDYKWLVDRRGARFISRGTPDQRSATFWVPMPDEKGEYLLNVALYDSSGTQLDVARRGGLPY